jgi:diadenosine tetraphosphate (Ap4A) HIT family hydrolase
MADYKSKTEKGKCIFCEIASGRMEPLGGGKFWENKKYMAWLSPFPNTPGFTVVIPKKHYPSDVLQMPDKDLQEFVLEAKNISRLLIDKLEDVGRVGLIMEGTGIDHAHIKLVPLIGTGYMKDGEWRQIHSRINTYFERYEGYISSNDGPRADDEKIKTLALTLKNATR